jgi:glycine dehydrogenase subunit 1
LNRAHYLADRLSEIAGVQVLFQQPFFNEFVISLNRPVNDVLERLQQRGIIGGINLSRFYPQLKNALLVAVTETNSAGELDAYAKELKLVLSEKEGERESELRLSTV